MSQHDYNIANGGGAAVRADINQALGAIQTTNSGSTAPTATQAKMPWFDTAADAIKFRNSQNTAWESAVHAMVGAGGMSFRNRIINGGMDVWQRGTSFTLSSGVTAYTADRFYVNTTGGAGTVSRVAGTGGFRFAMRITGASGVTGSFFGHKIESVNMSDLAGGNVTGQIRLAASANRTITWYARYPTADDNYAGVTAITSGTINVTTTPTTFTFSFAVPGAANTGLEIYFDIGALGAGATVDVTGYQLEAGTVATPFERRPYGTELALCQRYYTGGVSPNSIVGVYAGGFAAGASFKLPVTMRTNPTITPSSLSPTVIAISSAAATYVTPDFFGFAWSSSSSLGTLGILQFNYTASAEL